MSDNFQIYFKDVQQRYKTKDTTEHSFRTQLENFLKSIDPKCSPLHESKRDKIFGAPDFKIFFNELKIGYIETKDLGANLDEILTSEQIKKYTDSINNLILTNYCRFILLRKGARILEVSLFSPLDLDKSKFKISPERISDFNKIIDSFFNYKSVSILTSESLALELSKKAILIKDIAKEQIEEDRIRQKNGENYSSILDFYQGLEELIHDISIDDCVDAYAQTITYGLFLAKIQCQGELKREFVDHCLPRNIPVIQRVFKDIAGASLPSNLTWIFDEILDVLNATDIKTILSDMDRRGKTDRDPFTYFYEDFLQLYDPAKRERRGVYYTPRPVVNYIVKSVEWIIRNNFGKQMGFADDVTVLDPATGTGTFLWLVYLRTLGELKEKGLGGIINNKIKTHLLKDFYGLEILITPYIIAHLKLSLVLKRWFYELDEGDRVQVYLTNSLEQGEEHGLIPFMREINEERRVAHELVMKRPILAIIGNPPYSGMSANKGKWIDDLLKKGYTRADGSNDDGYYKVDGHSLGERNPKMLQDDYVKFIRFAQWKIDKSGRGVIGYITNNGYLDNITFKGMRQSLLCSFERLYILNLHGNLKKKEKCPNGSKDENVFDIQQGTSIVLCIKNPEIKDRRIYYKDLYGLWEEKYQWLDKNSIYTTDWQELKPISPNYFFVPFDNSKNDQYRNFWKITEIFPFNGTGIVTARDDLTIKWSIDEIWMTINKFIKMDDESAKKQFNLPDDTRDWKVALAKQDLIQSGLKKESIVPYLYRPFDLRYSYYTGKTRGFHSMPRLEIMYHLLRENIGLISVRQVAEESFNHIGITENIIDNRIFKSNKGYAYIFPLYIYDKNERKEFNINPELIKNLTDIYNTEINPENIFYYIYGVLHSQKYREKFRNYLKIDFARIYFTKKYATFEEISRLGKDLVEIHLIKKSLPLATKFEISGTNRIDNIKYIEEKVFINKLQYFEGIPQNVWNLHIGGYQVLDKWLKSRKQRNLSIQEIIHFIQIVEVMKETIRLMNEIDKIDFLSD